jgi:hypothetical protein
MLKTVGFPSTRTGDQTIVNGNLVIGTAGKGIDFSADPSAPGMTSELLDDYEEGTWTPGVSFGGASVGITYGTAQGFYTRVGNIVHVTCYLTLTSKGSSTGSARITGLPFNVNAGAAAYSPPALWIDAITYTGTPSGYANAGSGNIDMFQTTEAGAVSALTNANFTGSSRIMLNATYRAV